MTSLIYRLSGTTAAQAEALTLNGIAQGMQIFHAFNELSESTLKALVTYQDRVHKNDAQQSVIDHAICINELPFVKAQKTWNKVKSASKIMYGFSGMTELAVFAFGTWKSIAQRSPLKALGTIVLTFAVAYFSNRAHKLSIIANGHLTSLAMEPDYWVNQIANCRKITILEGLQALADKREWPPVKSPIALKNRPVIEVFTDREIRILLTEWVTSIKTQYQDPVKLGAFIAGHDLFESILKGRPENHSIRQAVEACNAFKSSLDQPEPLTSAFNKLRDDIAKTLQTVFDKNEDLKECFKSFYAEAVQKNFYNDLRNFDHFAKGSLFSEQLKRLPKQPEQVKAYMENPKPDEPSEAFVKYVHLSVSAYFNNFFINFFAYGQAADGKYMQWTHEALKSLPENEPTKKLLLSSFPQILLNN